MAFDGELDALVLFEETRIGRQSLLSVRANVGLVEIKERVLDVLTNRSSALTSFTGGGGGGGGGGGNVTVTRAVALCVPPGPVAVMV